LETFTVNKVAELSTGAPNWPVEVSAGNGAVVAWLDDQILSCGSLLLLGNHCTHGCLGLLLLRSQLDCLHGSKRLLLLHLILSFDLVDCILDHLE
jgi:hypothetical protein